MRFVVPAGVRLSLGVLLPPQLLRAAAKITNRATVEISRSSAVPEVELRTKLANPTGDITSANSAHRMAARIAKAANAVKGKNPTKFCAEPAGPLDSPRGARMAGRNPIAAGAGVFVPVV